MKSASPYAAERLLEIANTLSEYGWVDIDKLNTVFLNEGASPAEYEAGIEKLKDDGLITLHPSGARLYFTDKGAQRFA